MNPNRVRLQLHISPNTSGLLVLLSVVGFGLRIAHADPVSELASFSIFDKVDLVQLAKSDVKTAHGPPMRNPRFLAAQSCYVAPGSPAQQMEALRRWDPTRHRELKVFLHSDLASLSCFRPLVAADRGDGGAQAQRRLDVARLVEHLQPRDSQICGGI